MTRKGCSHRQATPMRFVSVVQPKGFDTPCYVCVSHKHNVDGYLYKTWKVEGFDRKVREPFYRFILRAKLGWEEWPEGLEANHKCGNRACCNPDHLQALDRSDHKRITNTLRADARRDAAQMHWAIHQCTGTALAERFGVSPSHGCRWIREWKAEAASDADRHA